MPFRATAAEPGQLLSSLISPRSRATELAGDVREPRSAVRSARPGGGPDVGEQHRKQDAAVTNTPKRSLRRVEDLIRELTDRVERLEGRKPAPIESVLDGTVEAPEHGRVVYSGIGPWQDRSVVWQMERTWTDVLDVDPDAIARVLAALASPIRIRIVEALMSGPAGTGEIAARVDTGTSGQLFHHLKELLAIGIVHQPQRGVYELRPQHALPFLAIASASIDLATSHERSGA